MQTRKRDLLAISGLVIGLALFIACAGGGEATSTAAPAATKPPAVVATPTKAAAPAATPTPSVKYGGILKLAADQEPANLDPHISTVIGLQPITYNKLVRRDLENKMVGDTAERWEIAPDGKSVTFYLRKGVKFWNVPPVNGREMTCEDWVYSLKRIGSPAPEFQGKDLVDGITGMECPDKHTLKLVTDPPFAPMLNNLTRHSNMAVVPKELVDQQGDLREKLIGTGPFTIKEWIKGQVIRYAKNTDYFVRGVPYLDGVDVLLIADKAARTAALRTKQIDIDYTQRTPKDKEALERTNPEIVHGLLPSGLDTIRVNATRPPFSDDRVRYAINLAIDRKKLIQLGAFGGGRLSGYIEPIWGDLALPMDQLLALPGYRYPKDQDIAEAKRLMAEAGYANGFKATSYNWEISWDFAAPVKEELAKIGIDVDMQNVAFSVWKPKMLNKDYDIAVSNATISADIDGNTYTKFHPKGGLNESGLNVPELNTMFEELRRTVDPAKRAKLAHEVELKLQRLGSWIPIGQRIEYMAFHPYVKGIQAGELPFSRFWVYAYVPYLWLDK